MTTFITETGSKYEVDEGRLTWRKNFNQPERIAWLKALKVEHELKVKTWADVNGLSEDRPPEVGERLYIGSRDVWWLSTKVVEIIK